MAAYFFDSSALTKRYVIEKGSAWVISITDPAAGNQNHLVRITGVEVISAITRAGRSGSISAADTTKAIAQFYHEFAKGYRITAVTRRLIRRAMILAEIHALRGYDAVQLAAALTVNKQRLARGLSAVILVSADTALNTAAIAEGLTVDDPNLHP